MSREIFHIFMVVIYDGNKRGETVNVERYSIEELVDGEWTNKQTHSGNSYTYTEGTSAATVRLKWLGAPLGTILVIQ